jgi:hypothetical protein
MRIESLLTIFGIAVTAGFGAWAISVAVRHRKVRIIYALDQALALTDDIMQSFSDLAITFRDQPISANLVLLKGYFINTGRIDITENMVEKCISINLPDQFEWIDCNVVDSSPSLQVVTISSSAQKVEFRTGLWKRKEYFKFDALAKVPVVKADPDNPPDEKPASRLRNALIITHRIANSTHIGKTSVPKPSKYYSNPFILPVNSGMPKLNYILAFSYIGLGLILVIGNLLGFFAKKELGYSIPIDGQEVVLNVDIKDDTVILSEKSGFSQELSITEFQALSDKKPVFISKTERYVILFGYVCFAMGILLLSYYLYRTFRDRSMLSIIATNEEIKPGEK